MSSNFLGFKFPLSAPYLPIGIIRRPHDHVKSSVEDIPIEYLTKHMIFANEIGSGAFGVVYKVPIRNNRNNFIVVKKSSAEFSGKDISEYMKSLKEVNHKNIVKHFGYRIIKNAIGSPTMLLFMEFVDGVTLRRKIKDDMLTIGNALSYTDQLVKCLVYMKSKNMIHRDIKPENIMIRKNDDCLKLTDFGLVKLVDPENWSTLLTQSIRGTPGYMAPEVIQEYENSGRDDSSSVHANYKVDVWSVGVVFTEMITGKNSFKEKKMDTTWGEYVLEKRRELEEKICGSGLNVVLIMKLFDATVNENQKYRATPEDLENINTSRIGAYDQQDYSDMMFSSDAEENNNDFFSYEVENYDDYFTDEEENYDDYVANEEENYDDFVANEEENNDDYVSNEEENNDDYFNDDVEF